MITQTILLWLGSVAVLASVGMFVEMDRLSNMIVPWVASILWGVVALSSSNVAITDTDPPVTASATPLLWLGIVFAMCCAVFGIYELIFGSAGEVGDGVEDGRFDMGDL